METSGVLFVCGSIITMGYIILCAYYISKGAVNRGEKKAGKRYIAKYEGKAMYILIVSNGLVILPIGLSLMVSSVTENENALIGVIIGLLLIPFAIILGIVAKYGTTTR